ncbi:MAG TPA: FemAB family XrtA/PEP-CTERM system-associated protein [Candidatus Tectomicrobia bacterium]|nr:FemAB family XrtA/PEP-CTERM system-associated protein [Candidatus Tectomicrobia bacterium]
MITVTRVTEPGLLWDRFVDRNPRATVGHLSAWGRIIAAAYGHPTFHLVAEEKGEPVGLLPVVLVRSRLFGRRLVSMPFLDYGGVLAEPGRGVEPLLLDAALRLGRDLRASTLGLRQFHPEPLPYAPAEGRVTMLLPLTSEEEVWRALPAERRNRIRKGARQGLTATWAGADGLDEFYEVFAGNMRDLGSPVHSRRFFTAMLEGLPDVARTLLVRDAGGRAVGAAVCLFFRDTVIVPWVSSRRDAFALCPNFVLYWEAIRRGCRERYRMLDLGRSFRSAGTFEFKRQWGAHPHPLPWLFVDVVPGARPPVDRDNGRYAALVAAWKRLPVPVANALGPWVRGQVPN